MSGNAKAMWSISKRCFVAVEYDHPETDDLKNNVSSPYTKHFSPQEIKIKAVELAIQFIKDNQDRGFKLDKTMQEIHSFLIK